MAIRSWWLIVAFACSLLVGCDGEGGGPPDSFSAPMISRVHITPTGTFLALHQELLLSFGETHTSFPLALDAARETTGRTRPLPVSPALGVPAGRAQTVFRSEDGTAWVRTDLDPAEIEWRLDETLEMDDATLSFGENGTLVDETGRVRFSPIEDPEPCLDRFSPNPFNDGCDLVAAPGPYDVATDAERSIVALGTEGVAVLDDGTWRQRSVETLRPRSFGRRHRTTILVAAGAGLFTLLVAFTYAARYRDE